MSSRKVRPGRTLQARLDQPCAAVLTARSGPQCWFLCGSSCGKARLTSLKSMCVTSALVSSATACWLAPAAAGPAGCRKRKTAQVILSMQGSNAVAGDQAHGMDGTIKQVSPAVSADRHACCPCKPCRGCFPPPQQAAIQGQSCLTSHMDHVVDTSRAESLISGLRLGLHHAVVGAQVEGQHHGWLAAVLGHASVRHPLQIGQKGSLASRLRWSEGHPLHVTAHAVPQRCLPPSAGQGM